MFLRVLAAALLIFSVVSNATSAQEADQRLQSDGKGWRVDKAKVTDAARPRVLLVGDSILNGYLSRVTKALDGKAYVDAWVNPYAQSPYTNKLLGEVLANGPYDVVQFNMGLHGWQPGRVKEGTFEPLMKEYVEIIRAKFPKATVIWASSTPVTVKDKPTEIDTEINPIIVDQNTRAARVMAELKVPVNDFYALLAPKLEWARGDKFHWTAPAYDMLGQATTDMILQHLPKPQN
jgi:hypothetical protein